LLVQATRPLFCKRPRNPPADRLRDRPSKQDSGAPKTSRNFAFICFRDVDCFFFGLVFRLTIFLEGICFLYCLPIICACYEWIFRTACLECATSVSVCVIFDVPSCKKGCAETTDDICYQEKKGSLLAFWIISVHVNYVQIWFGNTQEQNRTAAAPHKQECGNRF